MFSQIKTSKENKEVVAKLSRKLNLGKENTIARIAFSYSLSLNRKMDLSDIQDSGGKEYSRSVLFGDNFDIYIALICSHYEIYKKDVNIVKYVKMHLDDGLQIINEEIRKNSTVDGFDYLHNKIKIGIHGII